MAGTKHCGPHRIQISLGRLSCLARRCVTKPALIAFYRQYGAVTVSSSNLNRWVENHYNSLQKSEIALKHAGRLTDKYRSALAFGYFALARGTTFYTVAERPSFALYARLLGGPLCKVLELCPHFRAADETRLFAALERMLGFNSATRYLFWVRFNMRRIKLKLKKTRLLRLYLLVRGVTTGDEGNGADVLDLNAG